MSTNGKWGIHIFWTKHLLSFVRCWAAMDYFPAIQSCHQRLQEKWLPCPFSLDTSMWHMHLGILRKYEYLKIYSMSNFHVKVGTFTIYNERPDKLIYYDRSFHVMDVKVFIMIVSFSFNSIQFFSVVSVSWSGIWVSKWCHLKSSSPFEL